MLSSAEVKDLRFSPAGIFRAGYESDVVDGWLDRVAATLRAYEGDAGGSVELLAEDAREVRFDVSRALGSYSMEEVDDAVDLIAASLAAHELAA